METIVDSVVFTSTHVCENLARRMMEARRATTDTFGEEFIKITKTYAKRIVEGRLVQRQETLAIVNRLFRWLESADYIANVQLGRQAASRLSSKEDYEISFAFMQSDARAQWLQLSKGRLMIGRKMVQLMVSAPTMRIHRHAISRIIHRERMAPEEFVRTLGEANNLAVVLDEIAMKLGGDIALPYRAGLMLGRTRPYGETVKDGEVANDLFIEITRGKTPSFGRLMIGSEAAVTEIMSYVDEGSLSTPRAILRDEILAFQNGRQDIIAVCANFIALQQSTISSNLDLDTIREQALDTFERAEAMMKSAAWTRFRNRPKD